MYINQLPAGTQDFLPMECAAKRAVEKKLRELFISNGFDEVETPSFEYFDTFSRGSARQREESMFKFFDLNGRILVLRPDITVPIARMVTTKLPITSRPIRLFYLQNAFGVREYNIGQRSEYTQAGVEFIGKAGSAADAETIALAIRSLIETGLRRFKIELGQVEFFRSIIREGDIGAADAEQIRQYIDTKNSIELEYVLSRMDIDERVKTKLQTLPSLFGGRDVIERARELSATPECLQTLKNLSDIYDALTDFGLSQYIVIDLGRLTDMEYYSGVVFRGITDDIGFPILSGGRYDALYGELGTPLPAIGFAAGIKRVLIALERQGNLPSAIDKNVVLTYNEQNRAEAFAHAEELRAKGMRVILEAGISGGEAADYAACADVHGIITEKEEPKC